MKKIHKNVILGKHCFIEDGVELGYIPKQKPKNTVLRIGNNCYIRSGSRIYSGTTIGDNFQTGHNALIREDNTIGDNVSIGSNTEIALRNRIGSNTRIHSGCFLEDTIVGKNVFIGPRVLCTNDPHPTYAGKLCFKGAKIEDGAIIGGGVTLLPHIRIGKKSLVGAGSVVTKNVNAFSVVVGNPAKEIKKIEDIVCKVAKRPHKPYEKTRTLS